MNQYTFRKKAFILLSDGTIFHGTEENNCCFGEGTTVYVGQDVWRNEGFNDPKTTRIPVFLQFDEELINNFTFTSSFLTATSLVKTDHHPNLKYGSYANLINQRIYEVPTEDTFMGEFSNSYPKYSAIIDNASNPSLSADYEVYKVSFIKNWGIFYPSSDNHRWFSIGVGVGVQYTEGIYAINICDPYSISTKEKSVSLGALGYYHEGFCLNKKELYSPKINNVGLEFHIPIILYSYIGESWEFNFLESAQFRSVFDSDNFKKKEFLVPHFHTHTENLFSIVIHL